MLKGHGRILIGLVTLFILISSGLIIYQFHVQSDKRIGLILDCARNYYSPRQIKGYINLVSQNHGNYIQLHLTDNENFGVENQYLGQTAAQATFKDGIAYNPSTHHSFLTKRQLREIINYGNHKGVQIVPEIDLPGHSQALLSLLAAKHPQLEEQIQNSPQEMYYQKLSALKLSKRILGEYTSLLPRGSYLATGGDEIVINVTTDQSAIVHYENQLNQFLNQRGLKMIVWNDCIQKAVLNDYDKNILVNYWSLDGSLADKAAAQANAAKRATLPEINNAGMQTINCDANNTYLVMDAKMNSDKQRQFLKHLEQFNWQRWNHQQTDHNNIGTAISIWGEPTDVYSSKQIIKITQPLVSQFLKQVTKK